MLHAPRKAIQSAGRRCLAAVLVLAYVTTMLGVHWPESLARRGGSPYPCQGHQCGCRSAEECWSHCCCFTPGQRLAWAAANRVDPPAELNDALLAEDDADDLDHLAADEHSDRDHDHHSLPTCCRHHHAANVVAAAEPVAQSKKTPGHGFEKAKCHGISTLWVTSGAAAPPAAPLAWSFDWTIAGQVPPYCCSAAAVSMLPAVPPPRSDERLVKTAAV